MIPVMANVHELRRNVRNIYCIALSPNQNTCFFENNNASLCVCVCAPACGQFG